MTDAGPRGLIPGAALAPGLRRPVAPASVAAFPEVATASTPETTQLAPEEQAAFELWLKQNNIHDLDDPRSHYDYRGAFRAGVGRDPGNAHFPDTFKQHGHETFSNESQYSKGDGGAWQGDTFIPKSGMRAPAAGEPRAKETGPLGPAPAAPPPKDAPYGQRHLLPGISNLAHPPPPIDYTKSLVVTAPDGTVIPMHSLKKRDTTIVNSLGQSLFNGSGNEAEKRVASAVTEWGQSMVGHMPIEDIQKVMAERWDHNVGNVVKRDLGHDRILAAQANRGRGPTAGMGIDFDENGLPRPNTQFGHAVLKDYTALVNQTITREVSMEGYKALTDHENQLDSMLDGITSPNAMDQRSAVMSRMLEKSGKASTDMERAQLNAAAGKWAEFRNNLSLWLSGLGKSGGPQGAQMDQSFINQFAEMVKTDKATIARIKEETGRRAASTFKRVAAHAYGPQLAQEGADEVYRAFVGVGRGGEYEPPTREEAAGKLPTFKPTPPAAKAKPPAGAPRAPAPAKPPPKDANSHLD